MMQLSYTPYATPNDAPNDWWPISMRAARDALLTASDWAMTSDAPTDKQAWADYRQALRDFPSSWVPGPVADFPDPPA